MRRPPIGRDSQGWVCEGDRWIVKPGKPHTLVRMPPPNTDAELDALLELTSKHGFVEAHQAHTERRTHRCPVNGDGYFYTIQVLTTASGERVGSFTLDDGPRGPI